MNTFEISRVISIKDVILFAGMFATVILTFSRLDYKADLIIQRQDDDRIQMGSLAARVGVIEPKITRIETLLDSAQKRGQLSTEKASKSIASSLPNLSQPTPAPVQEITYQVTQNNQSNKDDKKEEKKNNDKAGPNVGQKIGNTIKNLVGLK